MANPGKNFRATDVVYDSALPYKRLIFGGVSGDRCFFVHYERGGWGLSYLLAFFNVTPNGSLKPFGRATVGDAQQVSKTFVPCLPRATVPNDEDSARG